MSQLMKGICIAISIKGGGIMKLTSELVNRQKKNLYKCVCPAHRCGPRLMYILRGQRGYVSRIGGGADGNEAAAAGHFLSPGREWRCYSSDLPTHHSLPLPPCVTHATTHLPSSTPQPPLSPLTVSQVPQRTPLPPNQKGESASQRTCDSVRNI